MAHVPYTPWAANVLRSAWMPAPAPESLPAIVSAVRMSTGTCLINHRGHREHREIPFLCVLRVLCGSCDLARAADQAPERRNESCGSGKLEEVRHDERVHAGVERRTQARRRTTVNRPRKKS